MPGLDVENYWFRRHEAVYLALAPACAGAVVLDAGVGEGYGAALLASSARRVIGVELEAAVAAHVAARYPSVGVTRADLQALPVADGTVDALVTLQVIEHLWDQPGFLAECARVLRPGGRLFCATPNRLTFSPGAGPDDRPLNPFHTRELTGPELAGLVADAGLAVESLTGLHHGPALRALDARHGGRSSTRRSRSRCPGTVAGSARRRRRRGVGRGLRAARRRRRRLAGPAGQRRPTAVRAGSATSSGSA